MSAALNGVANEPNGTPVKATEAVGTTYGTLNGTTGTNGEIKSAPYGEQTVQKVVNSEGNASAPGQTSDDEVQLVLQSFRVLIADLCQQFNMGHPG